MDEINAQEKQTIDGLQREVCGHCSIFKVTGMCMYVQTLHMCVISMNSGVLIAIHKLDLEFSVLHYDNEEK